MRVLKARFGDKEAFLRAYSDEFADGGMFCATTTQLETDEEVVVEINFPELPNKTMLRAIVVNWRPALPRLRVRAGATLRFSSEDVDKRDFLLDVASGKRHDGVKRRHSRLPVEVPIRWRPAKEGDLKDATLRDISVGGAQLVTDDELSVDDDLVIELIAPGGAKPINIAGKVSNRLDGAYGLRFVYRDGGGSRRLREVVRRLVSE